MTPPKQNDPVTPSCLAAASAPPGRAMRPKPWARSNSCLRCPPIGPLPSLSLSLPSLSPSLSLSPLWLSLLLRLLPFSLPPSFSLRPCLWCDLLLAWGGSVSVGGRNPKGTPLGEHKQPSLATAALARGEREREREGERGAFLSFPSLAAPGTSHHMVSYLIYKLTYVTSSPLI
jgi:hypothetical protein